jgi:hypothetical protein
MNFMIGGKHTQYQIRLIARWWLERYGEAARFSRVSSAGGCLFVIFINQGSLWMKVQE